MFLCVAGSFFLGKSRSPICHSTIQVHLLCVNMVVNPGRPNFIQPKCQPYIEWFWWWLCADQHMAIALFLYAKIVNNSGKYALLCFLLFTIILFIDISVALLCAPLLFAHPLFASMCTMDAHARTHENIRHSFNDCCRFALKFMVNLV